MVGTDDERQRDGGPASQAVRDERHGVDLGAKRGEAEDGAGAGDRRQRGQAGAQRLVGGAALRARHGVASGQHDVAQRALGGGGVVACAGNAEAVGGCVHGLQVLTCVIYSLP